MRNRVQVVDRLALKSDTHTLAHNLITRYNMSIAEAECLTQELHRKQLEEDPTARRSDLVHRHRRGRASRQVPGSLPHSAHSPDLARARGFALSG